MGTESCIIIKNDGIGDLIYASGIIAEISKKFKGNVDLVTCHQNRDIAENLYGIREYFYVSRNDLHFLPYLTRLDIFIPTGSKTDKQALKLLKQHSYAYAVCLRRFIRQSSLALMKTVNAEQKACAWQFPTNISPQFAERGSRGWYHYSGSPTITSELQYFKNFFEVIFHQKVQALPQLQCIDAHASQPEPKTVGLGIGGSSSRWPVGYWFELIRLLQDAGWQVTLFGGQDVAEIGTIIKTHFKTCRNLIGKINFTKSTEYLSKLNAFIGNDSGLSHFATLCVPYNLIILGGGTFGRFFPWPHTTNQYVIYYGLDCFDCDWHCKFKEPYCLQLVHPSHVFKYFDELIQSPEAKHMNNINPKHTQYNIAWRRWRKDTISVSFPEDDENSQ